jgi:predicted NBD/HSP70 family sugar kinase
VARRAGISQEELRRNNVSALLSSVHVSGPTSRAHLTEELGLNRSTIGDLTTLLEELGLVSEELPTAGGRSGRPSLVVLPREDVAVLAVDLGVDRITVALVGLGGAVLERRSRVHQRGEHDVTHVAETVTQMSRDILALHPQVRCLGVGVSVPGAVRAEDGMVRFAPNLGWVEAPFTELLADRLGLTVSTGNDANLGVMAEHLRGAAVGYHDVAYLSGSVGIGGGFLVGGVPLRGANGYAGEIGHIRADSNGPLCRCGSVGCWEMKVGENQLLTGAGRLPGGGPPAVAEVISAAVAGEARASEALDAVAEWTGVGLRAVVNIFNPEVIVLGGSLAQVWEAAQDRIIAGLDRSTLISARDELLLRPAGLGQDSSLIGAAELAFAPLLADPVRVIACDPRDELSTR